ncbi:MAG TPA: hypothetical protein DDX91_01855 [Ruminococcaceae bacterium]|nr:hypothetical protein [Oscillospiraceae bacterium]
MYELKERAYTESEKQTVGISVLMSLIYIALFGGYLVLGSLIAPRGIFYPYIFAGIAAVEILLFIANTIMSLVCFMKKRTVIAVIGGIVMFSAALAITVSLSGNCFKDIVSGSKTTTTDLYEITEYKTNSADTAFELGFVNEEGKYISLSLSENIFETLEENAETGEISKISGFYFLSLPRHCNSIEVKYYPNSRVFIHAEVKNDIA